MLEQIISGCQTGADQAGLYAAKNCGILTGGYVTKYNKTEAGNRPDLIEKFGLTPLNTYNYTLRTLANVSKADATWIFYKSELIRGSLLTKQYCEQLKKIFLLFNIENPCAMIPSLSKEWLHRHSIKTLNIAGNRESIAPGICAVVKEFLEKVFT